MPKPKKYPRTRCAVCGHPITTRPVESANGPVHPKCAEAQKPIEQE